MRSLTELAPAKETLNWGKLFKIQPFKVSWNCSKGIQLMKKHLFLKIYWFLARTVRVFSTAATTLLQPPAQHEASYTLGGSVAKNIGLPILPYLVRGYSIYGVSGVGGGGVDRLRGLILGECSWEYEGSLPSSSPTPSPPFIGWRLYPKHSRMRIHPSHPLTGSQSCVRRGEPRRPCYHVLRLPKHSS